ncbi:hypothetical protein IPC297_16510 [Pseudomonas aeruginosa]|nr:hypothetical protein IPC336_20485 [Pseudomonas aeruginosa]RQE59236.1 hypothetical protein IPC297_16510 [Pseudomonas aeruginosa]
MDRAQQISKVAKIDCFEIGLHRQQCRSQRLRQLHADQRSYECSKAVYISGGHHLMQGGSRKGGQ